MKHGLVDERFGGLDGLFQMTTIDFGVIRIVEHCPTNRRNLNHDGAEGYMQGLYTTEDLFQLGPRVATVLHFQPWGRHSVSSLDGILHATKLTRSLGEPIVRWWI